MHSNDFLKIAAVVIASLMGASNLRAASLCELNETTVFSCDIQEKAETISFCKRNDPGISPALQFKLGRIPHIQLVFPEHNAGKFSASWQYTRDNGWDQSASTATISFRHKRRNYILAQDSLGESLNITFSIESESRRGVNKPKNESLPTKFKFTCQWRSGSLNEVAQGLSNQP